MSRLSPISLRPFKPSRKRPWDVRKVVHLLERAGWGARPEEVARVGRMGPERAVEWLLHPERIEAEGMDFGYAPRPWEGEVLAWRRLKNPTAEERQEYVRKRGGFHRDLQGAWLQQMIDSPRGLEEKLTFFWHSHFATSNEKIEDPLLLYRQHQTLRQHGLGSFAELTRQMAQDPAMIHFLDSNTNVKGRPNENFARELMELYTMGEGRGYTEEDVIEVARCFTGYTTRNSDFFFNTGQHDDGEKTVLGTFGRMNGSDVIDIIMETPEAATFVPGKLWAYFCYLDPPPELLQSLGEAFRDGAMDIRKLLRVMFRSEAFYSDRCIGNQIKNPLQFLVGTFRKLQIAEPPPGVKLHLLRRLGLELFRPPLVNGWPLGDVWVNTNALILRYHFAHYLTTGELPQGFPRPGGYHEQEHPPLVSLEPYQEFARDSAGCVDLLTRHLFGRALPPQQRQDIIDYVNRASNGSRVRFDLNRPTSRERLLNAIYLLMSSSEYQLC